MSLSGLYVCYLKPAYYTVRLALVEQAYILPALDDCMFSVLASFRVCVLPP